MHRMTIGAMNAALVAEPASAGRGGFQIGALFAQMMGHPVAAAATGPAIKDITAYAVAAQPAKATGLASLVQSVNRLMADNNKPSTSGLTDSDIEQIAYDALWAQQHTGDNNGLFAHPLSVDQFGVICAGHIVDMGVRQQLAAHPGP